MDLKAKVAVVTGAAQGIGKAIAVQLAKFGYRLLLVARNETALSEASESCKTSPEVRTLVLDVTDREAGDKLLETCPKPFALINNAGMARSAPLKHTSDELIEQHMMLNFTAPMRLMRALLPAITENSGRVVNICSTAALSGYPYISAYVASKHALLGATRALAKEFADKGVCINAVCPGYVRTEMFGETLQNIAHKTGVKLDQAEAKLANISPQKRVFETDEVAGTVEFLLSDSARGINGQAITIDGGEIEH